jgi:hypothetical protein
MTCFLNKLHMNEDYLQYEYFRMGWESNVQKKCLPSLAYRLKSHGTLEDDEGPSSDCHTGPFTSLKSGWPREAPPTTEQSHKHHRRNMLSRSSVWLPQL